MSEGPGRKRLVRLHLRGILDHAKAETPRHPGAGLQVAGLLARHLGDRFRFQNPVSSRRPAVQQHLVEFRDILRRRKQSSSAQGRTGVIRNGAAIHVADRRLLEFPALGAEDISASALPILFRGYPPGGVFHAERIEQPLLHELGEGPAAHDLYHAAEQVGARRGIAPARAGLEAQRLAREGPAHRGERPVRLGHPVFAEAAGVREQITERDGPRRLDEHPALGRLLLHDPEITELRQVFLHRVIERQFAIVDQQRHRDGGDRLAHRGDPEDVVGLHLATRGEVAPTDSRQV